MFNEANKQQVLEMQSGFYRERIGKIYGTYKVIDIWYDWEQHRQIWKLQCQKCGAIKVTKNGKDYAKGRNGATCANCISIEKQKSAEEKKRRDAERIKGKPADPEWIGKVVGTLEVIDYVPGKGLLTRCIDCGKEVFRPSTELSRKKPVVCNCQRQKHNYDNDRWISKRIGNLTILSQEGNKFKCRCDCGRITYPIRATVLDGTVKTCGDPDCEYHKELLRAGVKTHGKSGTRLYGVWSGMKRRCYVKSCEGYPNYGGRGITICDEWRDNFENFYEWAMKSGYDENAARYDCTIDRIDNDGPYAPWNCRWADAKVQRANQRPHKPHTKRMTIFWDIDGETKSGVEWCKQYGVSMPFAMYRIKTLGMTPYEALTTSKKTDGRPRK